MRLRMRDEARRQFHIFITPSSSLLWLLRTGRDRGASTNLIYYEYQGIYSSPGTGVRIASSRSACHDDVEGIRNTCNLRVLTSVCSDFRVLSM